MERGIRVVHLDPDWFGDVDAEREYFTEAFEDVTVESISVDGGSDDALGEQIGAADVLLTHYTPVTGSLMDATGCSVVSRYATGIDGIDVEAATERGVRVTNVPTYCEREVGEQVITLALACLSGLPQYNSATANGEWNWRAVSPVRTAATVTFGFLAFGEKARTAASLASDLGAETIAYDPLLEDDDIRETGTEPVDFDDLIARSDVLSINVPLTDETRGMIDADVLSRLPANSVLVNTARGEVVDEHALLDALEDGPLMAAGLDVLANEPPEKTNPLLHRDDVIVTPHTAWYSDRSVETLLEKGSTAAIAAYEKRPHEGIVNPETIQ